MQELDNKITLGGTVSGWPHQSNKRCVTLWPCHYIKKYFKAKEELNMET
jgi:hypothetical protein